MNAHVRIIERRSDRRIMGKLGKSRTLCGLSDTDAGMTAYDVGYRDAVRATADERTTWIGCAACRAALPKAVR